MRGVDVFSEQLFMVKRLDDFIPANHPLRPLREMVNEALRRLDDLFELEWFNRTARHEGLSPYEWENLEQVQDHATRWMGFYNHERPNMVLGGITAKAAVGHDRINLLLNPT